MKEELNKILEELEKKMINALNEEKYLLMHYLAGQKSVIQALINGIEKEEKNETNK